METQRDPQRVICERRKRNLPKHLRNDSVEVGQTSSKTQVTYVLYGCARTRPWQWCGEQNRLGFKCSKIPVGTKLIKPVPSQELIIPASVADSKLTCSTQDLCHDQHQQDNRDGFSSLDPNTLVDWSAESRDRTDMFFPHLNDSSLKAESVERKNREAALQKSLQKLEKRLEKRYIKNAAVLPDLRLPSPAPAFGPETSSINGPRQQVEPPQIHSEETCKDIYHSVVDPMLLPAKDLHHFCGQQLGRHIKQALFEKLDCPTLLEDVQPDGQVRFTEIRTPGQKRRAPNSDLDVTGEPTAHCAVKRRKR